MQPHLEQKSTGFQGGYPGVDTGSRSSRHLRVPPQRSKVLMAHQPEPARGTGLLGWLLPTWASGPKRNTATSAAAAPGAASSVVDSKQQRRQGALSTAPTHLIIMVNGLFGSSSNWDVMCEQLRQQLPPDALLHPSKVNARFSTYQGIDACGQRLADEVRGAVAQAGPSLTRISVIAHSMGGLMSRYALGSLYNPASGTICGLQPAHFISMATPHCGCDADGVAQVPFIGWTGDIPLLGQQLYRFLSGISGSTASLIFQRTGQQFFLLDGAAAAAAAASRPSSAAAPAGIDPGSASTQLPLLLQMTQDCPDKGLYFYSALAAFKTRTCYANMDGDHLVGFANSSLRSLEQLPPAPPEAATAKGVVMEDALSAGFWPYDWQHLQQQWATSTAAAPGTQPAACAAVRRPYLASRDWTHASQQQAATRLQQQVEGPAAAITGSSSSSWHELNNSGSSSSRGNNRAGKAARQRQQQQEEEQEHPANLLAALELEAGGAAFAATAAVASGVRQQQQQQQQQASAIVPSVPGSQHAPATAAAAGTGPSSSDSGDELLDLQYNSPAATSPAQQSLASTDEVPRQQQQRQQQLRGGPGMSSSSGAAAVASAEADLTSGLSGGGGRTAAVADSPAAAAAGVAADAAELSAQGGDAVGSRAAVVSHMLRRLQELPWRRIDVSFQGAKFGFAHNNIQVTRRWWNFEGVAVPAHLAQQLQLMDELLLGPQQQQQQQQVAA